MSQLETWTHWGALFLTSNVVSWVLSILILLVGLAILYLRFIPKCRRLRKDLRAAIDGMKGIRGPTAFLDQYENVAKRVAAIGSLSSSWEAYERDKHIGDKAVTFSGHAEEYFNLDTVIAPNLNLRFYSAVPNYLTGAGILGTFVGLVAGIYLAHRGLTAPNPKDVTDALQRLLGGASLAFLTSIFGLIGSLWFSVVEKWELQNLSKLIGTWNSRLDAIANYSSPAQMIGLAEAQLSEAREQTIQLQRFNTDLAVSIASALEGRMNATLGPSIQKLVDGVAALNTNQASTQQQVLEDLAKQFKDTLTGSAGAEMVAMQAAFAELNQALQNAATSSRDSQSQLIEVTHRIADTLGESLTKNLGAFEERMTGTMEMIMNRLNDASVNLATSVSTSGDAAATAVARASGQVADAVKALGPVIEKTDAMLHAHSATFEQMASVADRIRSVSDGLVRSTEPLERLAREMHGGLSQMSQGIAHLTSAAEAIRHASDSVNTSQSRTAATWELYAKRFAEIDAQLASVFNGINEAQAEHAESVVTFVKNVDHELASSLQKLSAVVRELGEVVESLQEEARKQ